MTSDLSKVNKLVINNMASSDIPSQMEEKHFGFVSNKNDVKANDKNATEAFLNTETGRHNTVQNSTVPAAQQSNNIIEQPSNGELNTASGSGHNRKKSDDAPDSESMVIFNVDVEQGVHSETGNGEEEDIDQNIDNNLPNTVTVLKTPDGGKCYVIGTAHFSLESQDDVSKVIQAVRPHIVVVELCLDRIHVLQLDEETILKEAKDLNFNKIMDTIKQNGIYKGLFYILLLNMSAHLTKILGLAPGGEFRRALKEARQIPNCLVQLGDRPIKITFGRALRTLSWWQMIKLTWHLIREKEPITKEDVEKYKSRDSLEEMMAELAGEYPALKEVFVKERDIYLTHALQLACKPKVGVNGKLIPARVVGVVGMGHTIGIVEHWGKVKRSQIPPIMSIPPPSLTSKILKFSIRASVIGAIVYAGYKWIPIPSGVAQSFKSSVEGLLKVSASQ